jgi:hypothetical protein
MPGPQGFLLVAVKAMFCVLFTTALAVAVKFAIKIAP